MVRSQVSSPELELALSGSPVLAGVGVEAVRRLAEHGSVRWYRKGTYLCHQGDDSEEVFFLLEGRVEISTVSVTGTRVYHATVDVPQFVGELGAVGGMPRTATLLALRDARVWVVAGVMFMELVTNEPAAARAMLAALARQVQSGHAFVDDLLFLDLKGRVAKRLLQMVTTDLDELPDDGAIVPDVTQADLASLCGGSRENVTRILKEFERRGFVRRDGHRYVLRNVEGLAKIAEV
jgi:CRP/FNR family transcriptional regulator, cyclic AMP receptor protein